MTCHAGNDGSIDLTVFGGTVPYTYKWSNGASTQDISNLTAGPYEVVVIDADTCSNIIGFTISEPEQMGANVSSTDATCGLNDGTASITITGGMEPYSYLWSTGGVDALNTGLAGGIYSVLFEDANGCGDSARVSVNEIGAPVVTLRSVTAAVCGIANGGIDITASGGAGTYQFTWSNAAITEDLTNVPPGDYSVRVAYTASSCNSISTFTIPSIQPEPEPICMVSVDSATNRNMIIWEKPAGDETISSYLVYRETSAADVYQLAEIVDFADESLFIDTIADPAVLPWRYKISILDTCGNESELSELHQTIHLTMNVGLDESINLIWGNYLGFDYSTYYIYRYNISGEKTLVNPVAGSQTKYFNTYTDQYPPADVDYYVIELQGQICISEKKAQSHNTARSNKTKKLGATGMDQVPGLKHLSIYPNPNTGIFTLSIETARREDIILRIYDSQGKLVQSRKYDDIDGRFEQTLNLAGRPSGLYHLQLIMEGGSTSSPFIID